MRADIKIGEIWMESDLRLVFNERTISPPEPKLVQIELLGSSDVIDVTEIISGDVEYKQRTITIRLKSGTGRDNYHSEQSTLENYIHGKKLKIIFNKDPEFYWIGRISVSNTDPEIFGSTITITATVDPYKYLVTPHVYGGTVVGSLTITIAGMRKRVCPKITVGSVMTVSYLGKTYDLSVGENIIPDIFLGEGNHQLTFSGSGTVSVAYQGGSL
ncbi:Ig-like domain-containing protein [Eubacteriaceae bacterium ES2]|nr:Ig-like domain-containing protein [Eubacteriaceae bacterium ES2]